MLYGGRSTLCSVYAKWLAFDSIFTELTPFKIFTAHLYLHMMFSMHVVWPYPCGAPLHVWPYSLPIMCCSTSCVVLLSAHNVLLHFMCSFTLYLYFMSTVGSSQSPVVIDLTLSSDEEEDEPSRPR